MLQVVNLTKIYKTKNGTDVHALDGVSLQFPEKGMVFLLGKSGSGKSTLLNVCGGLDSPTSGEIIVKGKSSKSFSQSDFDSYRNTFIGFIFQEYNILNEFSVEDNIALALELQGKSKDKAAIASLLEQVDLTGFAKRKPSTLSGGQKQRIAIARALIKAPEIIMADEPTGALDSNTGKQVFDTLKKLSQDKLVIVVSHDRDFAEQYADRIIELKDGKILSDVTKTQIEQTALSENVKSLGDVLCIKNGAELTDKDFEKIKAYLKNSKQDVVIANGEKDVSNFKKVSRINDSGEKEVFVDTDAGKIETRQYSKEDSRFIRSKLPMRHATKIGLSGLKSKPVRLAFTILLCTVAFIMFGLLSTLSFYNSEGTFRQSLMDSQSTTMQIEKRYEAEVIRYFNGKKDYSYTIMNSTQFTDDELKSYKTEFGNDVFAGFANSVSLNVRSQSSAYWQPRISTFAYLSENNTLRQKINGAYPKNDNEILISSYLADTIVTCKVYDSDGNAIEVDRANKVIGKKITIAGQAYTISGIFDSGAIDPKYESLKNESSDNKLTSSLMSDLEDGLHLVAFVSNNRLAKMSEENPIYVDDGSYYRYIVTTIKDRDGNIEFPEWSNGNYFSYNDTKDSVETIFFTDGKTQLAENEIIISSELFSNLIMNYTNSFKDEDYTDKIMTLGDLANQVQSGGIWEHDEEKGEGVLKEFTTEQLASKSKQLYNLAKSAGIKFDLNIKFFNPDENVSFGDAKAFKIVGIHIADYRNNNAQKIIVTDKDFNTLWNEQKENLPDYSEVISNYTFSKDAKYSNIFLPYDHSAEQTDLYWNMYQNETPREDASLIFLTGNFVGNLRMVDETVKSLSQVFLYVGLVMAVFAALLFSNFISVSISQKKRDIGILRAVGARGTDVFKIFFSESFFISVICIILSSVGSVILCTFINAELSAGIGASLLVFGPLSFVVLIAVAIVTAIIATFLPVFNAAKKKPVDSIRSL